MPLIARAATDVVVAVSVACVAVHVALLLAVEPAQRGMAVAMLVLSLGCLAGHRRPVVVAGVGTAMVLWHLGVVHTAGPSAQPVGAVPDLLMHAGVSLGGAMAGLAVVGLVAARGSARSST